MKGGFLRRLIFEDVGLKLLSLALATLLWMFVVGENRSEMSLSVPLELSRVPDDMVIVSPVPEAVSVRLNGPRTLLAAANPQRLTVTLNLEGIQAGTSSLNILPSRLNLPRGIEVTSISPSVVTLEVDRKVRKTVPVRGRIRGVPAEGFEVAEVVPQPPEVELEGAEGAISKIREAPTEIVDVSGLSGRVTRPVELVLPDPTVRPLLRQPVELEITVREIQARREFIEMPVTVRGETTGPSVWDLEPPVVDITLEGPLRAVSRLKAADVSAWFAVSEDSGEGIVPVEVEAPENMHVLSVSPPEIRYSRVAPAPQDAPDTGSEAPRSE